MTSKKISSKTKHTYSNKYTKKNIKQNTKQNTINTTDINQFYVINNYKLDLSKFNNLEKDKDIEKYKDKHGASYPIPLENEFSNLIKKSFNVNKVSFHKDKFYGYVSFYIKVNKKGNLESNYNLGLENYQNTKSYSNTLKDSLTFYVLYFHNIPNEIGTLEINFANKIRNKNKFFNKYDYIPISKHSITTGTSIIINHNVSYKLTLTKNNQTININQYKINGIWFICSL